MDISHILAIATSMAPAPDGAEQEGHALVMIMFYVALFAIFYFLLIRPQTKKNQDAKDMQDALSKGDRILTTGGIFATIHKVDEDVITLEVAEGVRIKAQRSAISERVREATPEGGDKK